MKTARGMSLVDVIVGTALVLIVFLALLGILRASLLVSSSAKAKAGATAVASTQMEYIRSLPYGSVGTVGGIPAGPAAQYATTMMNGVPYGVRTLVQYVDDPKDGAGAADSNGIPTDYKRVRITTTYIFRGEEREVALVSNVAPPSMETTTGGGTLRVNVVNASGVAVPGASVRIHNPGLTPGVDVTTFTDLSGSVAFPGAPASTGYRVTVTKDGYSTAETYPHDATNQNPTPGYLTVAASQTTTGTFAIDMLGALTLRTYAPIRPATAADTFDDASAIEESVSVQTLGGSVTLAGASGSYALSGSVRATTTLPAYLHAWTSASAERAVPAGTGLTVSVTDSDGTLLPESVLPGNAAGFASFPIDLSGISTTTYPGLALRASLTALDPMNTPVLESWEIRFDEGPVPLPDIPFTLSGEKRKGTTGSSMPILKTVIATSTDATGAITLPLEWDIYELLLTGYDLVSASSSPPYSLDPGAALEAKLIVE